MTRVEQVVWANVYAAVFVEMKRIDTTDMIREAVYQADRAVKALREAKKTAYPDAGDFVV